jgi:hypothetical protein
MRPARPPALNGRALRRPIRPLQSEPEKVGWDKWLTRAANLAQPCLLALGAFGYFYTVVPVFQLAQLQEQTARLEIEKATNEKKLLSLADERAVVEGQIGDLRSSLGKEQRRVKEMSATASRSELAASAASQRAVEAETNARKEQSNLEIARWEFAVNDWAASYYFGAVNRASRRYSDDENSFLETEASTWPEPVSDLIKATEFAEVKRLGGDPVTAAIYAQIRVLVGGSSLALKCESVDFPALKSEIKSRLATLEAEVQKDADKEIESLREKYRGQRIEIGSDFVERTKHGIRITKKYEARRLVTDKLTVLRKECDGKAQTFIRQVALQKKVRLL